jgi:type II secretory pathway pseudopilin PulG
MPTHQRRQPAAFTIVELLVVIGVLGLLIGLLLPALSGAQKSSLKLKELNALRQVGMAWDLYATSAAERALPGFLDTPVQARWRVSYEYSNRETIPPGRSYGSGEPNIAGPWTWRLLPHLDYNYEMVQNHVDKAERDAINVIDDAEEIAYEPGFGYNAYYVGGWWTMEGNVPRYKFNDATVNGSRKVVVSTTVSGIRRSSELITFCSASFLSPGVYRKFRRDQPGVHYITPPLLGQTTQWSVPGIGAGFSGSGSTSGLSAQLGPSSTVSSGDYDPTVLEVVTAGAAPIGRYNRLVAILCADGHTDKQTPGSLLDMRRWIDAADTTTFQHN